MGLPLTDMIYEAILALADHRSMVSPDVLLGALVRTLAVDGVWSPS